MRTLKEDIQKNVNGKKNMLNECYKVKEMEAMSRAYSAFSNFARDIMSLKRIYESPPLSIGPVPMYSPYANQDKMSEEDKEQIRKKLLSFCTGKLDQIKEVIEETFKEKEKSVDDDGEEIKVSIERE